MADLQTQIKDAFQRFAGILFPFDNRVFGQRMHGSNRLDYA